MSARKGTSKRPAPANEHTETPISKRPRRSTAISATSEPTEEKSNDFTVDQWYWIRLHHYLMRQAVMKRRSFTALEGTVSCAYFNAYWQGYLNKPTRTNIAKPIHAPKTYKEFDNMRQELIPNVIEEMSRVSSENAKDQDTTEYRPVIVPSMLARFHGLWDKNGVEDEINWDHSETANEFNDFFDNIVREQTEMTQPAWVTAGRQNLLDRPTMEGFRSYAWVADFVSPHFQESRTSLLKTASDPKDVWRIVGHEGKRENFPMRRRKAHADAGNALLNMAIMRPAGSLGDLKSLGKDPRGDHLSNMSEDQRQSFHDHIRMVQQGNDLQKGLYEKAGWMVKDDEKTGEDEDGDVLLEDALGA